MSVLSGVLAADGPASALMGHCCLTPFRPFLPGLSVVQPGQPPVPMSLSSCTPLWLSAPQGGSRSQLYLGPGTGHGALHVPRLWIVLTWSYSLHWSLFFLLFQGSLDTSRVSVYTCVRRSGHACGSVCVSTSAREYCMCPQHPVTRGRLR
jgi:hypothetical protein